MEFGIEKCTMLIMKSEKRETTQKNKTAKTGNALRQG